MREKKRDLSVVISSYKKEFVIVQFLHELIGILNLNRITHEIVVVVDGNIDHTYETIKKNFKGNIILNKLDSNYGKGFALRYGWKKVSKDSELVAFIDSDLDIDLTALITGINYLSNNSKIDCVIGSKFHPNSKLNYSNMRIIQSKIYSYIVKKLFKMSISETQTGLKIFRYNCIKNCITETKSNRFAFDLELMLEIYKNAFKVVEIPIILNHNRKSTVDLFNVFETIIWTLKIYFRSIGRRKGN